MGATFQLSSRFTNRLPRRRTSCRSCGSSRRGPPARWEALRLPKSRCSIYPHCSLQRSNWVKRLHAYHTYIIHMHILPTLVCGRWTSPELPPAGGFTESQRCFGTASLSTVSKPACWFFVRLGRLSLGLGLKMRLTRKVIFQRIGLPPPASFWVFENGAIPRDQVAPWPWYTFNTCRT